MPFKSYVFYNNKGGVGKTTLAFNFAAEMAFRCSDKKVLIIDLDSQCNCTSLCLGGGQIGQKRAKSKADEGMGIKSYFKSFGRKRLSEIILNVVDEREKTWATDMSGQEIKIEGHLPANLHIACGSIDLDIFASALEKRAHMKSDEMNPFPFYDVYSLLRTGVQALDDSWIIVMDTNPSFSIITRLGLIAADELIIPSTIDEFSGGGVSTLMDQLGIADHKEDEDGVGITSFSSYLKENQMQEKVTQFARGSRYTMLPLAKVRTVVINRLPTKAGRAMSAVMASFYALVGAQHEASSALFAPAHFGQAEWKATNKEEHVNFVESYHFHEISNLSNAMNVSHNLGLPVTGLQQKHYRMRFELHSIDQKSLRATVGVDAVRFGLEIQDLVELCLGSSWEQSFIADGHIKGNKSFYQHCMVTPSSLQDHKDETGRRGRRKLPLETRRGYPTWLEGDEEEEASANGTNKKKRKKAASNQQTPSKKRINRRVVFVSP